MKKLMLFALVAGVFGFANASELWWMVGEGSQVDGETANWDTAKLYVSPNGYNYDGKEIDTWTKNDIANFGTPTTEIGDSMTSFYVELWNEGALVGSSYVSLGEPGTAQGSTDLSALAGSVRTGIMGTATPYSFSQFTTAQVIPEPTTGLLMLVGLAGLALKRRRA